MKKYVLKYGYMLLLLVLISCTENVNLDLLQIKGYDEEVLPNGKGLNIESFNIIYLEQTDNSIINTIKRVDVVDTIIIVQTQDKLLSFSDTGKFICQYGDKGNGANEYLSIFSYAINKNNNSVIIVDESSSKILTFDLKGNHISNNRYDRSVLSMWTNSAVFIDDDILFTNMIYNDNNNIYTFFNEKSETKAVLYNLPVKSKKSAEPIGGRTIVNYRDTFKIIVPFDNKLYTLSDKKMISSMQVHTNKPIITNRQLKNVDDFSINTYSDFMNEGYFTGFTAIFETDKYILLDELFGLNYFLVNKELNYGRLYNYMINDEFEALPLIKIIACYDNYFIGVGDPLRLIGMKDKLTKNITDDNITKFVTCVNEISFDSNPCLFFYRFK